VKIRVPSSFPNSTLSSVVLFVWALLITISATAKNTPATDRFFSATNIYDVHLTIESNDWVKLEPSGGAKSEIPRAGEPRKLSFDYVEADVEIDGQKIYDIGLRYNGQESYLMARNEKRPFKLDFNHFVKGLRFRALTKLNLDNNASDPTGIRQALAFELFREAGVPAPRTAFTRVYVTVPGLWENKLLGLYTLSEPTDERYLRHNFGTRDGALLKPEGVNSLRYRGEDWGAYEKPLNVRSSEVKTNESRHIIRFLHLLETANDTEFADAVGHYVDLQEFARFLAVYAIIADFNSILAMDQNYLIYLSPEWNKLFWLPWDTDRAFGAFNTAGSPEQRVNLSLQRPYVGRNPLLERLLRVDEFERLYRKELLRLTETVFKPEKLFKRIDELAALLRPEIAREGPSALVAFDLSLQGYTGLSRSTARSSALSSKEISLKDFMVRRLASVRAQLAGTARGQIISSLEAIKNPSIGGNSRTNKTNLRGDVTGEIPAANSR
jgi:spore coat protein H